MEGYLPLKPGGPSQALAAGVGTPGVASTGPSTLISTVGGDVTVVVDNSNNANAIWLGYGMSSSTAQANTVIPLLSGSTPSVRIAGKTVQALVLNGPRGPIDGLGGLWVNTVMEQGSGTVTTMVGYGT